MHQEVMMNNISTSAGFKQYNPKRQKQIKVYRKS